MSSEQAGGKKHDSGKPPVSLIPTEAIYECAQAFGYGAQKYSAHNFRSGIAYSRLIDAAFRHLLAYKEGEDFDKESGLLHLGHALASLAMLVDMHKRRPDLDDRYKGDPPNEHSE